MDNRTLDRHIFRFGVFELDTQSGELRRHGLKIRLPDQSFQILRALLTRPGEVVAREELRQVLWTAETFVDFEVGLNSAVHKLREALDDSAENPRFIETVPRRGYRFIAPVSAPAAELVAIPNSAFAAQLAPDPQSMAIAALPVPPSAHARPARPSNSTTPMRERTWRWVRYSVCIIGGGTTATRRCSRSPSCAAARKNQRRP